MGGPRTRSARSRLLAAGFTDTTRAQACLEEPGLGLDGDTDALVEALGRTADPDLALLTLLRLLAACDGSTRGGLQALLRSAAAPQQEAAPGVVHLDRLLAVLGSSRALGDFLVSHPGSTRALSPARAPEADDDAFAAAVHERLATVTARALESRDRPVAAAKGALRAAYYSELLGVAADDLTSTDPVAHVSTAATRLSALADAALDAALAVARAAVGPACEDVALAVIAMGKTGARELNYVSDVDVVYVVGPVSEGAGTGPSGGAPDEAHLLEAGTALALELARVVSAPGGEPALWPLDTGLRPEGKDGVLVRTLASHVAYYERWASSWEFQALLKARACAGDRALGRAYEQAVAPFVWGASLRENFVDDARAMRRRVERESYRPGTPDRRIKLGPGGLRDVEFTVQLLQLVHGRGDESLRVPGTLDALDALTAGGYVSRQDSAALAADYRVLRLLEHRSQLLRLSRTHELPTRDEDLRRIGRVLPPPGEGTVAGSDPAVHRALEHSSLAEPATLRALFEATRRRVRDIHEQIYYRPLLGAAARLTADEMTMTAQAACERLTAGGYLDPDGALHHIQALTEGVSRRAAIQRQLLPVIIGWLADGPDPDSGLLSFRRLSEAIGGSHWYLATLRDSPSAARRLCHVLSGARWTTDLLAERPEAIAWLDDDADLVPREPGALEEEVSRLLHRRVRHAEDEQDRERQAHEAVHAVMSLRSRELLRAALADSLDGLDPRRTARVLTDATDAAIAGVLQTALALVLADREGGGLEGPDDEGRWPAARARHAVIAMGRLGGRETTYSSDADLLFVHEAVPGADEHEAAQEAEAVARTVLRLLADARPHPLEADAGLRPEGRQGPMSRSLASYAGYYARWMSAWERQALLRARPCAGDRALGQAFLSLIAPLRWAEEGADESCLREVRRLKARMESERMPRGTDPRRHLKLGPGGLSDVEWAVQVLQLTHAGRVAALRTTSTLEALEAARTAGLLTSAEAGVLSEAWLLATRVRAANVVGTGRTQAARADVLPSDPRDVRVVGRLLGLEPGRERELEDLYRRAARHARPVVERLVFGARQAPPDDPASPTMATSTLVGSADPSRTLPTTAPRSRQAGRASGAAPAPGGTRLPPAPGRARRRSGPYPWS
ncbi:bifunctional [glutamine synthetase] adenylyltransferase/[glutamine synthetase]-adenylyl-L-tyrosine phosphorylase [Actinomyces sp. 186855]|nr:MULTISPECIES: bifunctional [glutamine synthetase] adenylyltransferase/[glutamine synthetase]-adenylyl-L-tyrosine phosphorylase [unclassified Actinomyces]MCL3777956.1 bifunctional [glutamine synthetase] adenylyltransferase/[glutamine synthetase]-adenylyl-L-tyrosine phosphorylase [Actinomyces sp. AC-20-1]MCL3790215.1 bifunctional [glutamine synthetase] adenylyltransferase/[glutamine synthetase]-adenylyl-L-tyrosine phosphorylase [Actinomyces sp. 187325]MCL3792544.1 bifunctional [glutamine synthe